MKLVGQISNIWIEFDTAPMAADIVLSVTFTKGPGMALVGVVTLAPQADPTITSRPVLITFGGGSPSVTVDMIIPNANFQVPPNETAGMATPTGPVNPVGTGPAGTPFPFTIPMGPTIPPADVVTNVTFMEQPVINPLAK